MKSVEKEKSKKDEKLKKQKQDLCRLSVRIRKRRLTKRTNVAGVERISIKQFSLKTGFNTTYASFGHTIIALNLKIFARKKKKG